MHKKHVAVFYGGMSPEHDISRRSAQFIFNNIDKARYQLHAIGIAKDGTWLIQDMKFVNENLALQSAVIDENRPSVPTDLGMLLQQLKIASLDDLVCFPILHGANGEDGRVQGLFEYHRACFVGPDTLSSAVCMDKVVTKRILSSVGIETAPFLAIMKKEWKLDSLSFIESVSKSFEFPVFVKPVNTGSSVGISKVYKKEQLAQACDEAFQYDQEIMVEPMIVGKEVEFVFLGETGSHQIAGPAEIVVSSKQDFYSYEAKYSGDSEATVNFESGIAPDKVEEGKRLTAKICRTLKISGMSRVDFFYTGQNYVLNEVNTIPGFTSISVYPSLWEKSGVLGEQLISQLLEVAIDRYKNQKEIAFNLA